MLGCCFGSWRLLSIISLAAFLVTAAKAYSIIIRSRRQVALKYFAVKENDNFIDVESSTAKANTSRGSQGSVMRNLIEMAQLAQPDSSYARSPFFEPDVTGVDKSIDCAVHYCVSLDDEEEYYVATPFDHEVAICEESLQDGTIRIVDPASTEMKELFEIPASILKDMFGTNLVLLKTPRTLTVIGDLDRICQNIQDGKPIDDYLDKEFVNPYAKNSGEEPIVQKKEDNVKDEETDDQENAAERLFSFEHEGRLYSLIRMLEQTIFVGKDDPASPAPRRLLLTPKESEKIIPQITKLFKKELDDLGISYN